MRANLSKYLIGVCLLTSQLITFSTAFAKSGGAIAGGGGDTTELRVDEIRADILNWINKDGASELKLSADTTYETYVTKMTEILQPKKVVIGFVEKDDENNDELKVSVGGIPKTCRGFFSTINSIPHILCNISRFKNTSESEQYKLIHHEYAGLVNIEKNENSASDYYASSQITNFLIPQVILKLAVKNECGPYCSKSPVNSSKKNEIIIKSLKDVKEIICRSTFTYDEETPEEKNASEEIFIFRQGLRKRNDTKDIPGQTSFVLAQYNTSDSEGLEENGEQQFYFESLKQNKVKFNFIAGWKASGELKFVDNEKAVGFINQKSHITEFNCALFR